ncbi:MAG: sensor histidine kinase [Alphaproteobacteria bacterium]
MGENKMLLGQAPVDANLFNSCDFLFGLEDLFQDISDGVEEDFCLTNILIDEQAFSLTISRVSDSNEGLLMLSLQSNKVLRSQAQSRMQAKNELSLANEILEKAKLESEKSNEAKSWFLSTVSHELRTPLSIVIGNVELLSSSNNFFQDEDSKSQLNDAKEYSSYMLELVNDLLDLTKASSGNVELSLAPVNLSRVTKRVANQMTELAARRTVQINTDIKPDVVAVADSVKLQQIVSNLLSNAIKFSHKNKAIELQCYEADELAHIKVIDQGLGLTKDQLSKIGQPFVRFENEIADQETKGTGLGLALVKSFVSLHKGQFQIESEVGHGTSVRVSFPVSN